MLLWEEKFWHLQQTGVKQNPPPAFELTVSPGLWGPGTFTAKNKDVSESLGNHWAPTAGHKTNSSLQIQWIYELVTDCFLGIFSLYAPAPLTALSSLCTLPAWTGDPHPPASLLSPRLSYFLVVKWPLSKEVVKWLKVWLISKITLDRRIPLWEIVSLSNDYSGSCFLIFWSISTLQKCRIHSSPPASSQTGTVSFSFLYFLFSCHIFLLFQILPFFLMFYFDLGPESSWLPLGHFQRSASLH